MAYNRIQAGRLLAASELPVFEASLGEALKALTAGKLRVLIKRARTMRDKAQDLLQRQRVATRGRTGSKGGTTGAANERTEQKLRALGEALTRFENRLAQLDAAAERAAGAAPRAPAKRAAQVSLKSAVKKARVAKQAGQAQAAGRAPARSAKAPATTPTRAGTGVPAVSTGADAKGMVQQRKFTGSQAIQGHVGARGRRVQAQRDKR